MSGGLRRGDFDPKDDAGCLDVESRKINITLRAVSS